MTTQHTPDFNAELLRQRKATESAQALVAQWQAVSDRQREEIKELDRQLRLEQEDAERVRSQVRGLLTKQSEADREIDELQRQLAELTHVVGTETPIAAFDLATTWAAEKAHYMEQIEALTKALDAQAGNNQKVVAEAGLLYKTLQEIRSAAHFAHKTIDHDGKWAALCEEIMIKIDKVTPNHTAGAEEAKRLWEAGYPHRVSSNDLAPAPALEEETQRCAVCGWPLKDRIEDGCTRDSCSMRPLPTARAGAVGDDT